MVRDHMERTQSIKHTFTPEDVYARAQATLEQCLLHGVTHMRTQVEVDPNVGLLGFEALEQLRKDYAWAIDIQPCVFLQEGWTDVPGADENLVACLKRGAPVVGGGIRYDKDGPGQIRRVFELAQQYDIDVDFHLDGGYEVKYLDYPQVCEITDQLGWQGRVAFGHGSNIPSAGERASRHRQTARRVWRVAGGPAGDRPLQCGTPYGTLRDARRDRRQHAHRTRRELHHSHQQRDERFHALWGLLVDPHRQSLRQCRPAVWAEGFGRVFRDDHGAGSEGDAASRLRDRRGQSRGPGGVG